MLKTRLIVASAVAATVALLIPFTAEGETEPFLPQSSLQLSAINVDRLTPRQYLWLIAAEDETQARELDLLIRCESGWKMIKNRTSSAYGYCQFLDSTWRNTEGRMGKDIERTDPYDAIDACVWLYSEDGITHWLESQGCHGITD